VLVGIRAYYLVLAKSAETNGRYQEAAQWYQKVNWPVAWPPISNQVVQMESLAQSAHSYEQGKMLIEKGDYKQGAMYLDLVDPLDKNYQAAQILKRQAELKQSQ